MHPRPSRFGDVLVLRVALRYIEPAIWRTLRVPADVTLDTLHAALQVAFGWKDYHLHAFQVGDVTFTIPDAEDELFAVDERGAPLGAIATVGTTFVYRYDFGDDWEHEITVAGVETERGALIACTGGARACPPEDCGGPPGYQDLIAALADRHHPEHAEMKRWAGSRFDPEKLDLGPINKKLAALSKKVRRRR
jgi:hypothetical protein